ncbi:lipoprotein [Psychromonas sp. KJ10-2]|uniref:lipoprotein n=1 Tax=Psychromonas sp. KJ10-2 TaxID=3391822 RepID=UPI0039B3A8FF
MKKIYLGLTIAALLTGCANTAQTTSTASNNASTVVAVASGDNLIADPQLTEFRSNSGKSDVWKKAPIKMQA